MTFTFSVDVETADWVVVESSFSFSPELEPEPPSKDSSDSSRSAGNPVVASDVDSGSKGLTGDPVVASDVDSGSKGLTVDPDSDSSSADSSTLSLDSGDSEVDSGSLGFGVISPSHSKTGQQRPGRVT